MGTACDQRFTTCTWHFHQQLPRCSLFKYQTILNICPPQYKSADQRKLDFRNEWPYYLAFTVDGEHTDGPKKVSQWPGVTYMCTSKRTLAQNTYWFFTLCRKVKGTIFKHTQRTIKIYKFAQIIPSTCISALTHPGHLWAQNRKRKFS